MISEFQALDILIKKLKNIVDENTQPELFLKFSRDNSFFYENTDEEIIEIDEQIQDEIEKGILPDPNAPVDEFGNPIPEDPNMMGEVPQDEEIDAGPTEADMKGGEI